jgi:hypothetical protein
MVVSVRQRGTDVAAHQQAGRPYRVHVMLLAILSLLVLPASGALAAAVAGPPSKVLLGLNALSFLVWAVLLFLAHILVI